jgi:hypothetical protein
MIIALYAALAMILQDILAVCLVQAEARDRAALSGLLDAAQWGAGIATTTISVTALQGHSMGLKAVVVAAVTAANFGGSWLGVQIGRRLIKAAPVPCPHCAHIARTPGGA